MPKPKSSAAMELPGAILAVEIEPAVFCYLRKYQFGYGVLPFLSNGIVREITTFPSVEPRFHIHIWVLNSEATRLVHVAHAPFATESESYGQPMYLPPDAIETCYRIHGVFNGLYSIRRPATEEDVVGMERFRRFELAELSKEIFSRYKDWTYIES